MIVEYNTETEKAVIGSFIKWPKELRHRLSEVTPDDFCTTKDLFIAIRQVITNAPEQIDSSILLGSLNDAASLYQAVDCMEYAIILANFSGYLSQLKELSAKRELRHGVMQLIEQNRLTAANLQELVDTEKEHAAVKTAYKQAMGNLDDFIATVNAEEERIKTGFLKLDRQIGGLRLPSVCYIGARPSTGKTAFALNIALNQVQNKRRVLFFSLEMTSKMILERMVSCEKNIDYAIFSRQAKPPDEVAKAINAVERYKESGNLCVLDDIYSVEEISNCTAQIQPHLVIIDYIQKVTTMRKHASVRERIDYISGELKRLAKYNNCCVIALSQITRDGKEAPTMSNLKESGALEADGDYIMLLHRPYVLEKNNESVKPYEAQLLVDKNKFGNAGVFDLCFDGSHQRFTEVEWRYG